MTTPLSPSLAFPRGELDLALSEQSFGISSYEVTESTDLEASARVVLLEGDDVLISLTSKGYTVLSVTPGPIEGVTFEALEDLLQSTSEKYRDAKQKVLMDKLLALQSPQG